MRPCFSLFLFFCGAAPSGRGRLLLEGRVPPGGRLRRALVRVVALLGSGEGQPPEERPLIGGRRLRQRLRVWHCENLLLARVPFCRLLIGCWSSLSFHWPVCCPFPGPWVEAAELLLTECLGSLDVFHKVNPNLLRTNLHRFPALPCGHTLPAFPVSG